MNRTKLDERKWQQIEPLLPPERGRRGRPAGDNRTYLEGILWIHRTGAPWRDLPDSFPPWQSIYTRFRRWIKKGIWKNVLECLSTDCDQESIMIDSSVVRAHQHSAGGIGGQEANALGRSCGGISTKIHAAVDGLGNPIALIMTPGQTHDITPAIELVTKALKEIPTQYILADKAYDADNFLAFVQQQGAQAVIPPKKNRKDERKLDRHIYKERHLVECFFARLKQFRRVATRYDKLYETYLAMVQIGCILVWLA